MASCLIPTYDLPVTREESHCLSAVDFPEADSGQWKDSHSGEGVLLQQ